MEIIYNLGDRQCCIQYLIVLAVLLECKTEKRNSQCEHGQPMEQQEACFARATQVWLDVKQHQCHIWRMNSMFEANFAGKLAWQLPIKFCVGHEAMNGCKNLKIH